MARLIYYASATCVSGRAPAALDRTPSRRAPRNKRRALALVETAIVLLLLLLLTFGVMEYGWMFLRSHEISNAARHGARVAARADATNGDVNAEVDGFMTAAGITGHTVTITPDAAAPAQTIITVTVSVGYAGNLELIGFPLLPVPATLQAAVSMAKEGT